MLDEPAVASEGVVRQLLHRVDPSGVRLLLWFGADQQCGMDELLEMAVCDDRVIVPFREDLALFSDSQSATNGLLWQ